MDSKDYEWKRYDVEQGPPPLCGEGDPVYQQDTLDGGAVYSRYGAVGLGGDSRGLEVNTEMLTDVEEVDTYEDDPLDSITSTMGATYFEGRPITNLGAPSDDKYSTTQVASTQCVNERIDQEKADIINYMVTLMATVISLLVVLFLVYDHQ